MLGGIASNQTPTTPTASNGIDYVSGSSIPSAQDFNSSKLSTTQTESAAATNISNIYDSAGGLDKFLLTAAAAKMARQPNEQQWLQPLRWQSLMVCMATN